jgi:hypothetical protein
MYRQLGQDAVLPNFTPVVPSAPSDIQAPVGPMPPAAGNVPFSPNAFEITYQQEGPNLYPFALPAAPPVSAAAQSSKSATPGVQAASVGTQFQTWLNTGSNKLYLALGGVIFVVAAVAGKKRRR